MVRKYDDKSVAIIDDEKRVHMAHMDIDYGYSVNGVAYLHTEILKNTELNNFYKIYPEKFNNKTNGITFRRWLLHCNHELADLIASLIGPGFKKAAMETKHIRLFMEWCAEGPSTYPKRKAMFEERKAHMESEIAKMHRALDMLKIKCWYYEQAIQDGNEDRVKALIPDNLPEEIKDTYDNAHTQ